MTEKCTTKRKMSPWTITSQPLCHPPRITMQAQNSKVCSATKSNQQQRFAKSCLLARGTVPLGRQNDGTTRCIRSIHGSLWDVSCSGHFACSICWLIERPRKDAPWHKAYIFLRLLRFARQKLHYNPPRCFLFCSQVSWEEELERSMTLGKIRMMIRFWAGIHKGSILVIGNIFFSSS